MMRMHNISMTTRVERNKLLATLKDNLARHSSIVQEARDGYIKKAREALERRMEQLRKGQVVSLSFTMQPPTDYSEIYKNTISMLEWNTEDYVELKADEFRQLVKDEWDWSVDWLSSNRVYSKKAHDWLNESMGGALVEPFPE